MTTLDADRALDALLAEGRHCHGADRLADAAAAFRRAMEAFPGAAEPLHLAGVVAAQQGHFEEARRLITAAVAIAPDVAAIRSNLGNVHCALGNPAAAEQCFRDALALDPDDTVVLFNLARVLDDLWRRDEAIAVYRQLIQRDPACADAHNNLASLLEAAGQTAAAVESYRRAVALEPTSAFYLDNLGQACRRAGDAREAVDLHRRALDLRPDSAVSLLRLGSAFDDLGLDDRAEDSYRRAIGIDATLAAAHNNLGRLLEARGDWSGAEACYRRCIALEPDHAKGLLNLGQLLYGRGRVDDAAGVFRQWLSFERDNPIALHMIAACTGEGVKPRASDDYIRQIFDGFAEDFEAKLDKLDYRAPALVGTALRQGAGTPDGTLEIVDLGCGTGLCGPHLRPYARRLVGVDLSTRMLDKARARAIYDELRLGEITGYLADCERAFDVAVAADLFPYFGDLVPAFAGAARVIHPGGRLIFTVERAADGTAPGGYVLNPSGRYAHSAVAVGTALAAAGFASWRAERVDLRLEAGQPVDGLLFDVVR